MSNPITRKEKLLKSIANGENPQISPITREEQYLSFIAGSGNSIPIHPITREEIYLDKIARQGISGGGGSNAILVQKTITENGEYPAVNDGADGYSKVVVNVASGGGDSLEGYFDGSLTEITLPNIESIGTGTFYGKIGIQNVIMPKVKTIGDSAFRDCRNLSLTSLPDGLTSIGFSAFYGCQKLSLTSLPSGLTSISDSAFYGCINLKTITFKGTPSSIWSNIFSGCSNLTTINVPWAEGAVANAPWGATNATINYNYKGE